jgi:hypothetical protein
MRTMKVWKVLLVASAWCASAAAQLPTDKEHYQLKRSVHRLELEGTPLSRILCTVTDSATGAADTVTWDPEERRSPVRYALLPKEPQAVQNVELSCRGEPRAIDGGDLVDVVVAYVVKTAGAVPQILEAQTIRDGAAVDPGAKPLAVQMRNVQANSDEGKRVLQQQNDGIRTSRLRSLDPTTALVNDAMAALATVALERAENAGKEYARRLIREYLCSALTIGSVTNHLGHTLLGHALKKLNWPVEQRLLRNTCALVDTLRLDELVSAKDAIWRAAGVDVATIGEVLLAETLSSFRDTELRELLKGMTGLVSNGLTNKATTSERDAQVLLLTLSRIGFQKGATPGSTWQYAMELGMAVLQDCLAASECSADELERLLDQESKLAGVPEIRENWAELPAILGRAATVLRPPPGTPPATTAANTISVLLDVIEKALSQDNFVLCLPKASVTIKVASNFECDDGMSLPFELTALETAVGKPRGQPKHPLLASAERERNRSRERALGIVRTLRGVVEALQGGDVASPIAELGKVFETVITDECEERNAKRCKLPVKTAQVRKGFRVLAAIAAYGASYREQPGEDRGELEKLRADERKKAVESLVDAVTDRSDRYSEWLVSVGTNVSVGPEYRAVTDRSDYVNRMPLALPLGLALQRLRSEQTSFFAWPGFHAMFSVLDLSQYLSLGGKDQSTPPAATSSSGSSNDEAIEPAQVELTTALRLGAELGLLFGDPSYPLTLSAHGAWIPRVKYGDDARDEWSVGASVGVFVPFFDFN